MIGVWIKHVNDKTYRCTYDLAHAKMVVDYCMGSSLVEDWGFYSPREKPKNDSAR